MRKLCAVHLIDFSFTIAGRMLYNNKMIKIRITENEENQRLDKFLRKYFRKAPLSYIYKLIRKQVKVNGRRAAEDTRLALGDELTIYISQEEADSYLGENRLFSAKRQFRIAYEDAHILIVEKPFGLLTHGTQEEKKNTLSNQVLAYLIEKGEYRPGLEKTFAPAPVNRLDRNTTGLVMFGKDYASLQCLNRMLRERGHIRKYYLTVVRGELKRSLQLADRMEKDEAANKVKVHGAPEGGKLMETIARPLAKRDGYTLTEVELLTGRTHQIRAHLAAAGYPVIGDLKYGDSGTNRKIKQRFGLSTQFLHAYKLCFDRSKEPLNYMTGKEIFSDLPPFLEEIREALFPGYVLGKHRGK